jgi:hypothetical protein
MDQTRRPAFPYAKLPKMTLLVGLVTTRTMFMQEIFLNLPYLWSMFLGLFHVLRRLKPLNKNMIDAISVILRLDARLQQTFPLLAPPFSTTASKGHLSGSPYNLSQTGN